MYEAEKGTIYCRLMRFAFIFLVVAISAGFTGCLSFKKNLPDVYIDPVVRMETELNQFFGELDKAAETILYRQKSMLIIK